MDAALSLTFSEFRIMLQGYITEFCIQISLSFGIRTDIRRNHLHEIGKSNKQLIFNA